MFGTFLILLLCIKYCYCDDCSLKFENCILCWSDLSKCDRCDELTYLSLD